MNRLTREYIKTLKVLYHSGRCGLWPQSCNGVYCNGHIGHNTPEGFEELSSNEYNFLKQKLGIPLNTRYYEVSLHGKRYGRRGEVISEGIISPSDLFDFTRMHESKTYIDPEKLIEKFGCEIVEEDGCCCVCEPPEPEEEIEEE